MLDTIDRFRRGETQLLPFINHLWEKIHRVEGDSKLDVGLLEDRLSHIEIIYALASEARQAALDKEQADAVEKAVDEMVSALTEAL